ncbi:hypothetical protein ACG2LH_12330 [Zhouia sp. PK063]|uniref:hypothetical protein n=1 Tax=Zhouia sp. PK063 TaxID=3373602 RepID=UPI003797EB04
MKRLKQLSMLFSLLFLSCQQKPMNGISFDTDHDYKMFFLSHHNYPKSADEDSFFKQHHNFYIDDKMLLDSIKSSLIGNRVNNPADFEPTYQLNLIGKHHHTVFNGLVDIKHALLLYNSNYYHFSLNYTMFPETKLHQVEKERVALTSIKNTRKFLRWIQKHDGLYFSTVGLDYYVSNYNAMTIIKAKKTYFNATSITKEVTEKVAADLKKLGNVMVSTSFGNDDENYTFYVYTEKINPKAIPSNYTVVKPLSDAIDEFIIVYNIPKTELEQQLNVQNINNEVAIIE